LRIMYGLAGERRLPELELPWLAGYQGSIPVRVGDAASEQHQLDVYGEGLDSPHLSRPHGVEGGENTWRIETALVTFLEGDWEKPDEGIWEIRGPGQQFTHSKVMAWVAVDRAVRAIERFGHTGPLDRWRALRAKIHHDVCEKGFDPKLGAFVQ